MPRVRVTVDPEDGLPLDRDDEAAQAVAAAAAALLRAARFAPSGEPVRLVVEGRCGRLRVEVRGGTAVAELEA